MRRFLAVVAAALLALAPAAPALAQGYGAPVIAQYFDLNGVGKSVTAINLAGAGACNVVTTGVFSGTVTVSYGFNGDFSSPTTSTTITAPGNVQIALPQSQPPGVSGAYFLRAQTTTYASGDPLVQLVCPSGAIVSGGQALGAAKGIPGTASCAVSSATTCSATATIVAGQHCVATYDSTVTTVAATAWLPIGVAESSTTLTIKSTLSSSSTGTVGFQYYCN